ncbi:Uma2 family endonuclease [Trichothermofontia sp.]
MVSLGKDLGVKRQAYASAGIREYWVVNLPQRVITVLRDPQPGDYGSEMTVREGHIYPIAFPDVAVAVQRLLDG